MSWIPIALAAWCAASLPVSLGACWLLRRRTGESA